MANAFHGVPNQLRLRTAINHLKPGGRFGPLNWLIAAASTPQSWARATLTKY